MPDHEISCEDCKAIFTITEDQHKYFIETGYTPPTRCKECEEKRRAAKAAEKASKRPRRRYRG